MVRPELARQSLLACCGEQQARQEIVWAGLQAWTSQLTLVFHKMKMIRVFIKRFIYPVRALIASHADGAYFYSACKNNFLLNGGSVSPSV